METNDSEVRVEDTNINEGAEVTETEAVVPEKPPIVETLEAKRARLERQLKKTKQQLGIAEEEVEPEVKQKSFTLDLAAKAFLNSNGIKGTEEYNLVKSFIENTGKDPEEVIESKFFQSELKELRSTRESRMASDATSGGRRGQPSARDTVDYWVSKGELPPPHMVQLRREVVNARLKVAKDTGAFANVSVIGKM